MDIASAAAEGEQEDCEYRDEEGLAAFFIAPQDSETLLKHILSGDDRTCTCWG